MKQLVLLAVVSFLFAIGGATWISAIVAPPPPPEPAKPATVSAPRAAPRPTARVPEPSADSAEVADSVNPTPPPQRPIAAPRPVGPDTAREKAVAKIMASMKAKDAGEILGKLSDREVERILRQMNAKQVASLLSVMSDDRAAAMSRRLLQPVSEDAKGTTP